MTPAPAYTAPADATWLTRPRDWLDARGKGAWIAAIVVGCLAFWPVGLALLAYAVWSGRLFGRDGSSKAFGTRMGRGMATFRSSGNAAFDSYKADTLKRLEDEQGAFEQFLQRLREARDKAEFDQFMADRAAKSDERADA